MKGSWSMQYKNHLSFMALIALLPVSAHAWEHDFTRGLDLYSTTSNGATIRLVCDPNRVYGGTESMILIALGGESDLNSDTTFSFDDGPTISAPMVHGRLSKRDLDTTLWQPLLGALRNAERVHLTVNGDTRTVDLGKSVAFTCV